MAGLVPQYSSTIADEALKKRYAEKLELVDGIDPYEHRYSNLRLEEEVRREARIGGWD